MFAYTLQLYFDFSGYCDMAIGASRIFGIKLPLNFHSPYQATSIIDFWRRWHMTLSRFLRDYLYFSLGGNRRGFTRRYLNLFLTMAIGGLWHGAAWTFVFWGAMHGAMLIVNHAWRAVWKTPINSWWSRGIARAFTLLCVALAWVFFRCAKHRRRTCDLQRSHCMDAGSFWRGATARSRMARAVGEPALVRAQHTAMAARMRPPSTFPHVTRPILDP